jgi:hypothetical protein
MLEDENWYSRTEHHLMAVQSMFSDFPGLKPSSLSLNQSPWKNIPLDRPIEAFHLGHCDSMVPFMWIRDVVRAEQRTTWVVLSASRPSINLCKRSFLKRNVRATVSATRLSTAFAMALFGSVLLTVLAVCKAQAALDVIPGATWTAVRVFCRFS